MQAKPRQRIDSRTRRRQAAVSEAMTRRCPMCRQPPGKPCLTMSPARRGQPYPFGAHPERKQ